MDRLRLATAGSVDDGKSTLIGRLLHESRALLEDQLAHVASVSAARGLDHLDLALVTDGLRAEREQGITIDVAYRYFATPVRRFVIADTPGHEQYTRNMVTGASTADVALVLVDARRGLTRQSRRHVVVASLLQVPHLVVCVNKMDLVGWDREVFERRAAEITGLADGLGVSDVIVIPVSALHGDNVSHHGDHLGWYEGPTLLWHLEHLPVARDRNLVDVRFPVQHVIRPGTAEHPDYRGLAGRVAAGVLRPGDEVVVLPSGLTTTIAAIDTPDGPVDRAEPPRSVTVRLTDDLDVGRGDLLCRPGHRPTLGQDLDVTVVWMQRGRPLVPGRRVLVKHTTRTVRAVVREVRHRLDVDTLAHDAAADSLDVNDIGRVSLRTTEPLAYDDYGRNRTTGSCILIDEADHATAGAGLLHEPGAAS